MLKPLSQSAVVTGIVRASVNELTMFGYVSFTSADGSNFDASVKGAGPKFAAHKLRI